MKRLSFPKVAIKLPQPGRFVFAVMVGIALLGLAGCGSAPEAAQPQASAPISEPAQVEAAAPADSEILTEAQAQPVDTTTLANEEPGVYKRTLVFKKSLTEAQHQVLIASPRVTHPSVPQVYQVPSQAHPNITVPTTQYNPITIRTTGLNNLGLQQLNLQIQSQQMRMAYSYNPIYDFNSPLYQNNLTSSLWTPWGTPNYLNSFYNHQFNPVTIQPITPIQINPITIQPITPIQINPIYIQPITPIYINPITTWP